MNPHAVALKYRGHSQTLKENYQEPTQITQPLCMEYIYHGDGSPAKHCSKLAVYAIPIPGCEYCGGSDCGDSNKTYYFCLEHGLSKHDVATIIYADIISIPILLAGDWNGLYKFWDDLEKVRNNEVN